MSDVIPGTCVYLIRQQCSHVEQMNPAPVGRVDPLPNGLRPAEGVLGAYATKEYAQFYMDRAASELNDRHEAMMRSHPEGANATPDGIDPDAWAKLKGAATSSTAASRVPDKDSEIGYKWVYRKWNVVVSVWIERVTIDTPPAVSLW